MGATTLVKQLDGTRCAQANCVAAGFAMLLQWATKGARTILPHSIRRFYGRYCPGIPDANARDAVRHYKGITMVVRWGIAWDTFRLIVVGGRAFGASVLYSTLHGTPYDACRTFHGRHRVTVFKRRYNTTLDRYEYLVGDPLADGRYPWIPKGPQWWPQTLLSRATSASAGAGKVNGSASPTPV